MDKLTHHIPQIRISEKTRLGLDEMSIKDKRKVTDYVRIILDEIVENYQKRGNAFLCEKDLHN